MNKSGTTIVLDDASNLPLQGLTLYGKSTQDGTPTPEAPVPIVSAGDTTGKIDVSIMGANLLETQDVSRYYVNASGTLVGGFHPENKAKIFRAVIGKTYYITRLHPGTRFRAACVNELPGKKGQQIVTTSHAVADTATQLTIKATSQIIVIDIAEDDPENTGFNGLMVSFYPNIPYEPYVSESLSIESPNGLPGIPVTSGGNYTDADGQQWICDEIDFARGKYVQRFKMLEFDGTESWKGLSTNNANVRFNLLLDNIKYPPTSQILANILSTHYARITSFSVYKDNQGISITEVGEISIYDEVYSQLDAPLNNWKSYLAAQKAAGTPVKVVYELETPVETDLTPEQMQAYAGLHTYHPNTTITNDADAWMYVQYISNSDLPDGPYSNPKTEIGKYYKALAGYSNEVPPPTCRETQLISNLLDANYQVPFENTTCSIEGYLWDMIRGTDVMANYTPKFESEKFLAMLTGKLVTDYPPKDCERNFWMAKCVEAQARMKVLRRGGKSG